MPTEQATSRAHGDSVPHAGRFTYLGLFLVTLGTLMFQVLLTRIFSVSMRYHFAFMAISVALFGITLGATLVYVAPRFFQEARTRAQLVASALMFSVWMVLALAIHLQIPHKDDAATFNALVVLTYLVISIPFVFGGVCITLVLTRFPLQISSLYATDLVGSSLGCVAMVLVLGPLDGMNAVVLCGVLVAAGALCFAIDGGGRFLRSTAAGCCALTAAFLGLNVHLASRGESLLEYKWVKGHRVESRPLYEKWNSFSRIQVQGDPDALHWPVDLATGPNYRPTGQISRVHLDIDSDASTEITKFDGNLEPLEFLRYSIMNLAHHLRSDADVCVIGSGGGRDILSALVFDQRSVVGIEINHDIVKAVTGEFGEYTGHLDRDPRVRFVADEARSVITRSGDSYDIIQVSMIDTWAATAAGAFVLSENSLYTVEGWEVFLDRLKPGGILSFCRWYYAPYPGEVYRLVSLAREALERSGAENPRDHMILVRNNPPSSGGRRLANGFGVLMVSRDPFTPDDIAKMRELVGTMGFELVMDPAGAADETFAALASSDLHEDAARGILVNVEPPTDDSPFFFNMVRLRDVLNRELHDQGVLSFNMRAVTVLGVLLLTVTVLSVLFIIVPLATAARYSPHPGALPLFVFFTAIGLGFMLIEVSQMQRLIVFLGHPSYGLSVILFSLLLSSGLGSLSTARIDPARDGAKAVRRMALLFLVVTAFGFATTLVLPATRSLPTAARIATAVAILFPMGFCMGTAFPLGMKAASVHWKPLAPILFGINGAMSVFASVCAVAVSLFGSISLSFWAGAACYLAAYLAFLRIRRRLEA